MTLETSRQDSRNLILLSFACFITLGISVGLLGVAWPSIQAEFGLQLDAITAVLITSTIGFTLGSIVAGNTVARRGLIPFLIIALAISIVGYIGYTFAPSWWVLVAFGLLTGLGAGTLDAGLNIFMAGSQSVRTMNWMHACFGIGATLGPLIMTAVLTSGLSWRLGFGLVGGLQIVLLVAYLPLLRKDYSQAHQPRRTHTDALPGESILDVAAPRDTLRKLAVWLAVLLFFLYTGVESTAGQWTFTLFTEARGVSTTAAGTITSVFWAMLTIGRIVFGAGAQRIGIERLLRLSMLVSLGASVLVAINNVWTGYAGIALMGLSLSAIYPTLVSETPRRVGIRHAANSIGYQMGGAAIGFAVLPGLAGTLAVRVGLESIAWVMVIGSVLMLIVNEIAIHIARRDKTQRLAAASLNQQLS